MNATDVLDAYLDQHCKRSFQSSKTVLRGKPPCHGEQNKTSSSSPKRASAYGSLRKAPGPLSPASSPAKRSKEANPAIPTDEGSAQISKQHKLKDTPNPMNNTAQRCAASMPLAGRACQQQTASKPSASAEQRKGAYRGWPKAEVKRSITLPVLSGAARDDHASCFSSCPCPYAAFHSHMWACCIQLADTYVMSQPTQT